jgi:integrase
MPLKLVRRAGSASWYMRGKVAGRVVFQSTKTTDKVFARILMRRREAEILKISHTFLEAADAYVSWGGEERFLAPLRKHFGRRDLLTIVPEEVRLGAERAYPGVSHETKLRQFYTPFRAVWNHAASLHWVDKKVWPAPKKKRGSGQREPPQRSGTLPVTYERAWQFVSAMSPAPAMVMTTLFYTGMRPIELFALQCEDIDIEGRWIKIWSSKTGEPRGVPMHEVLVPLLGKLRDRGASHVFLTPRCQPYPLTEDGGGQLKSAISGARRRSGITDISPYTARHTVSTQLVINGVHAHMKDQILGHAVTDMSRRYTNIPQRPLIEAINTLPVIPAWRDSEWMQNPLAWQGRLVKWGHAARRDSP